MNFQNSTLVHNVVQTLHKVVIRKPGYKIMHVCGTHEHTISRWGLRSLLPEGIEVIAGPGCPVCVCPSHEVGEAIEIARHDAIVVTFGDMMNLPTRFGSLSQARAEGADIRLIYSPMDTLKLARNNPDREVVLFAVGFETTAAPIATVIGSKNFPKNLSVLISHRLTPPVVELLLGIGDLHIDGLIAPGHVSTITGSAVWRRFPEAYRMPVVVAGFEPEDILLAIWMLVRQLGQGEAKLENEYARVVPDLGNQSALAAIEGVFEVTSAWWRGIGRVPRSGLRIRPELAVRDARERFGICLEPDSDDLPPGCSCHLVMLGKVNPPSCPLYGKKCTPSSPYGPCMVSQEGTCYIWFSYRTELSSATEGEAV
jgi:hydrogenase expression/formation protein HypD